MPDDHTPRVLNKLAVFVSSTGDLVDYRDAVEEALRSLSLDERRYEAFPSTPRDPLSECLNQVARCDALVLILGDRYGSLTGAGLSFTHEEYREARKHDIPIFSYRLTPGEIEPKQQEFIAEVEGKGFRCALVDRPERLSEQVKVSFLQEFQDAFRNRFPPSSGPGECPPYPTSVDIELPKDPEAALILLQHLFRSGDDVRIHLLAAQCELYFLDFPPIMALVFASEVNLAQHLVPGQVDKHRLEKAAEFWSRTDLDDGSDDAAAARLYNRGNALDSLKRYSEAINSHKEALALKPSYAQCWKNLGSLYDKVGDSLRAIETLEKALEIEPTLIEGQLSLGAILIGKHLDPAKGLKYLQQICLENLDKDARAVVLSWQAYGCLELGRFEEGVANAEEAIKVAPGKDWGWMAAARLYSVARRADPRWLDRSAGFFKRFIGEHPEDPVSWAELGHALWHLSDWGKDRERTHQARNALVRAVDLGYVDEGFALDRIAHAEEALGNPLQAENFFRQAAIENPAVFGICHADFLIKSDRPAEALPILQSANRQSPQNPALLTKLAQCYELNGELDTALTTYERAVDLDPENGDRWFNFGGMLWNAGDPKRAHEVWMEAIERFPDHEARKQADKLLRSRSEVKQYDSLSPVHVQPRNDE